jgi:hypothetical protein
MKQFFFTVAAPLLICFVLTPASAITTTAHRFHTSLTRMDYNAGEKSVEITIQLFTHDLQVALERKEKKSINFEKTPKIDEVILKYLDERFVLKNKSGEVKRLHWVGMEIETDSLWLYVETAMPESINGATLENRIFQEIFGDQINLVTARFEDKKIDLVFQVNDKVKEIDVSSNIN